MEIIKIGYGARIFETISSPIKEFQNAQTSTTALDINITNEYVVHRQKICEYVSNSTNHVPL